MPVVWFWWGGLQPAKASGARLSQIEQSKAAGETACPTKQDQSLAGDGEPSFPIQLA
jgi:hypothetical protein